MGCAGVSLKSTMPSLLFTAIVSLGILGFAPLACGQPRPERLEFDAASIRVNQDNRGGSIVGTPGGLTARNAEFSRLISMAFQTRDLDLSKVPEPLRSERFDIVAKASGRITGGANTQKAERPGSENQPLNGSKLSGESKPIKLLRHRGSTWIHERPARVNDVNRSGTLGLRRMSRAGSNFARGRVRFPTHLDTR